MFTIGWQYEGPSGPWYIKLGEALAIMFWHLPKATLFPAREFGTHEMPDGQHVMHFTYHRQPMILALIQLPFLSLLLLLYFLLVPLYFGTKYLYDAILLKKSLRDELPGTLIITWLFFFLYFLKLSVKYTSLHIFIGVVLVAMIFYFLLDFFGYSYEYVRGTIRRKDGSVAAKLLVKRQFFATMPFEVVPAFEGSGGDFSFFLHGDVAGYAPTLKFSPGKMGAYQFPENYLQFEGLEIVQMHTSDWDPEGQCSREGILKPDWIADKAFMPQSFLSAITFGLFALPPSRKPLS